MPTFNRSILFVLSFCAAVSSLAGCGSGGKIAAVVNGQVITAKEIDDRMTAMSKVTRQAVGTDRARVLEQMVMESLLLQEAKRRGLEHDREVKKLVTEARRQILFGRLVEVLRDEQKAQVPQEEVAAYYEEHRAEFAQPDSTRASHILADNEEAAKKALSRVKAGEPFGKVAEDVSTDPSRTNGGDIGFFTKGQVIPEFEAACEKLKPGEVSDVVKTPLGWHVILVTEKRAARERALAEVEDRIRGALEQRQKQRHLEQVVKDLRSKAQIQLRDKTLKPSPISPAQAETPLPLPDLSGEKTEQETPPAS
ncbi:MAG: peptidylprolyl isomerase [Candidatus Omnitrophica bacterium]|nr:peptidylprolyl isomerase [Candidatus Omnitrophota bacterium]